MGLVRYCINLDEILERLPTEDKKPSEYIYETGWQRSKGFRIDNSDVSSEHSTVWEIDREEIVVTGLRVATVSLIEDYTVINDRRKDSFNFIVNDEILFENVYLKDIAMYKDFKVGLKLKRNDTIEIKYYSRIKKPTEIWFDIDFLSPPELYDVTIKHQDVNGVDLLSEETRRFCVGEHTIVSEKIDGYYVVDDYFQTIDIGIGNTINEIIFKFVKL